MDRRPQLHELLCSILGSRNVYFQPPESVKLVYPCIIYSESVPSVLRADSMPYKWDDCYDVLVVERDYDSNLSRRIVEAVGMARISRHYISDNLHHTSIVLYY